MTSGRSEPLRAIAHAALAGGVACSALAAGGWRLEILPVIGLLAYVAFVAYVWQAAQSDRSLRVPTLVLGLGVLALFTLFQALPLPSFLLNILSPKGSRGSDVRDRQRRGPDQLRTRGDPARGQ